MNAELTNNKGTSFRDLIYVLFRRKWVIVLLVLATVIPVTLYTLSIPTEYEAESRLLVKPGRQNIYVAPVGAPEGGLPPTVTPTRRCRPCARPSTAARRSTSGFSTS